MECKCCIITPTEIRAGYNYNAFLVGPFSNVVGFKTLYSEKVNHCLCFYGVFLDEKGLNFHLFSLRTESLEQVSVLNDKRRGQVNMELLNPTD